MSMSQEEIEALMNGLDIEDDDTESEEVVETVKVNTKEIEELLSQTEDLKEEINEDDEVRISLDDIANIKGDTFIKNSEIESLLNDIESSSPLEEFSSSQDILNDIHSVDGNEAKEKPKSSKFERSEDDIVKDWTSSKINEGIFPLPAEKDTKVVNQLSQVANDSEEKVSQIFDVLSLTLDNNNDIRATLKSYENFISSQVSLLVSLNNKFPNIKVFDEHLANAKI